MLQPTIHSSPVSNRGAPAFRYSTLMAALLIAGGTSIIVYAEPNTDSACQTIDFDEFGNQGLQCGEGATADGGGATAVGTGAGALGFSNTSIGANATSSGSGSTAVGSVATSTQDGTSVGFGADAGEQAAAFGSRALSAGKNSIALGAFAEATREDSTALGYRAESSGTDAIAIGSQSSASSERAIAIGSDASGFAAISLGFNSRARASQSIAIGVRTVASERGALAIGGGDGLSEVFVNGARATGLQSTAIGSQAFADNGYAAAFGAGSSATGVQATALGSFTSASGPLSVASGPGAKASGAQSIVVGAFGVASGNFSTAIGRSTQALGRSASAFGDGSIASALLSTAIGFRGVASGDSSIAVGPFAEAAGPYGTAIGRFAQAAGANSFAAGREASAGGIRSTALGSFAEATGTRTIALGDGAKATPRNSTAIGYNAVAAGIGNIAIGDGAASYTLAGLAGTGTRSLLVQADGTLITAPTVNLAATASFTGGDMLTPNPVSSTALVAKTLAEKDNSDSVLAGQLSELFAMVESANERIRELEKQLAGSQSMLQVERQSLPVISVTSLEEAGMDSFKAKKLVNLNEKMERSALELRDTATREGWLVSDQFHEANVRLQTVDNPLRLFLGDADYAEYLKTTAQTSRIVINAVMTDSAASRAGLQAGDDIQDYAGSRVFTTEELKLLSASGVSNDMVAVTVLRNEEPLQLFIERGPLGIRAIDSLTDETSTDENVVVSML